MACVGEILKVSNLSVKLGGRTIMKDLSFTLQENDVLAVLGPNGAGKSTLIRALLGLIPYQGEVSWKRGLRFGYVPQRVPFKKELPVTVADFFTLKKISPAAASALLAEMGIHEQGFMAKQLGFLSSGQFQRVLVAWAWASNPDVLLFDEPTAGVDVSGDDAIHDCLHKTQKRRSFSIILVTHDLASVNQEATQVLCMNQIKYCYGPPAQILDPQVLEVIYGRKLKFFEHRHG